jgi:hypothetical protein
LLAEATQGAHQRRAIIFCRKQRAYISQDREQSGAGRGEAGTKVQQVSVEAVAAACIPSCSLTFRQAHLSFISSSTLPSLNCVFGSEMDFAF